MAGSPIKKARKEREEVILSDPDNGLALICDWMAEGKHLTGFCTHYDVSYTKIRNWIFADPERQKTFAHAREAGADAVASLVVDTLSTEPRDTDRGNVDSGHVTWLKNKADGLKWMASKLKPSSYGDKVETTIKGDADNPLLLILQQVQGTSLKVNSGITVDHNDS